VAIQYSSLPKEAHPIYSYEAKWVWDTPTNPLEIFKCPAPLSAAKKRKIEKAVRDAYKVLQIRDWCRIDVRLDESDIPNILELNPLPGILPNPEDNSCFPKAARTAGYDYAGMLNRVVEFAAQRYGIKI
jgi:D-alanine-D-alanine ligase